jgi:hypothetical protein
MGWETGSGCPALLDSPRSQSASKSCLQSRRPQTRGVQCNTSRSHARSSRAHLCQLLQPASSQRCKSLAECPQRQPPFAMWQCDAHREAACCSRALAARARSPASREPTEALPSACPQRRCAEAIRPLLASVRRCCQRPPAQESDRAGPDGPPPSALAVQAPCRAMPQHGSSRSSRQQQAQAQAQQQQQQQRPLQRPVLVTNTSTTGRPGPAGWRERRGRGGE